MEREPFEVEFLADGPSGDSRAVATAPVETSQPRRSTTWWLLVVVVLALAGAGFLVARGEGGDSTPSGRTATAGPTSRPAVVGLPAPIISWSPVADAPSVVYLGGCTACARFPRMSSTAVRAVMAALPGARIEAAASVVSSETGRVFTRTARIRVGAGVVLLNVDAATGMFETSFTQTDDRISVQVGVDGFRVRLRSTGGRVQVTDLLRLGEDPRLVAA